jgi:hypothetical protein
MENCTIRRSSATGERRESRTRSPGPVLFRHDKLFLCGSGIRFILDCGCTHPGRIPGSGVRIDAGAVLSPMMVGDTPEEMALKAGSPPLITIRKNAIRMTGQ